MRPLGMSPRLFGVGFVLLLLALLRACMGFSSLLPSDPHTISGEELYEASRTVDDTSACVGESCTFEMRQPAALSVAATLVLPSPSRIEPPAGQDVRFHWQRQGYRTGYNQGRTVRAEVFDTRPNLTSVHAPEFTRFRMANPRFIEGGDSGESKELPLTVPHMGMILGLEAADGSFSGITSVDGVWSGADLVALEQELRRLDVSRARAEEPPEPLGPYRAVFYQPVPAELTVQVSASVRGQFDAGTVVTLGLGDGAANNLAVDEAEAEAGGAGAAIGVDIKGKVLRTTAVGDEKLSVTVALDESGVAEMLLPLLTWLKQLAEQPGGPLRVPARLTWSNATDAGGDGVRVVPAAAVDIDSAAAAAAPQGSAVVWVMVQEFAVPVHVAMEENEGQVIGATAFRPVRERRSAYGLPILSRHWGQFSHTQRKTLRGLRGKWLLSGEQPMIIRPSKSLYPGMRVRRAGGT